MVEWLWQLCGGYGQALAELTTATGKQVSFTRNNYASATCTISVDDEASLLIANELKTGWPRLKLWRRAEGANTSALVFNGYFAPMVEQAEIGSTLQITARSPFGAVVGGPGTGRPLKAGVTYTATDAGAIASNLLTLAGGAGLAIGNIEPTKLRDITFPLGQQVGEAIINLSAMLDGFDFTERFVDTPTLAYLDISLRLGTNRPDVMFQYGEGTLANLRSVGRTTQTPTNAVLLTGADGLSSYQEDAGSILTYGYWPIVKSFPSISIQATLDDRALSLIRPKPIQTVQIQPETNAPKLWDDFVIGDTVSIYANRGSVQINTLARVNGCTILIDDNGLEQSEIPDPQSPDEESSLNASLEVEVI